MHLPGPGDGAATMTLCAHPGCDLEESEHHAFVAVKMPDGCKCEPREWCVKPIPPVCADFIDDKAAPDLCDKCEHMSGCHPPKTETTTEKEGPTA